MEQQRILVADDYDSHRKHLTRYFENLGYIVDTAQNYIGVRELLDKHDYALIFSDNAMPLGGEARPDNTCGLQLLAHAKLDPRHKDTPFVIHTADDSEKTKALVKQLGGVYLEKDGSLARRREVLDPLLKK